MFDNSTDPKLREQILNYFISGVMTDTERAKMLGLPEGCRIREGAKILAQEKLVLGKYVWIGEGAILDAQGGLTIGDYTQVGLNVMLWSHNSHKQAIRGETGITRENIEYTPTKIGKCCFIAGPSVITAGVTIGDRVTITPGSVVSRDLPDDAVYNPNRDRYRADKRIAKLEENVTRLVELLSSDLDEAGRKQEMKRILESGK